MIAYLLLFFLSIALLGIVLDIISETVSAIFNGLAAIIQSGNPEKRPRHLYPTRSDCGMTSPRRDL